MKASGRFERRTRSARSQKGVALVEFAVTLPIMMVLVVGIFDFGTAFNLKQKLTASAEIGARFGAMLPTTDLSTVGVPDSVISIRNVIDDYLTAQGVNDCNIVRDAGTQPSTMVWTFNASGSGCPATFGLTIRRAYAQSQGPGTTYPVFTRVEISYPYSFYFGRVSGLINGSGVMGSRQLLTDAIQPNMD